MLLGPYRMVKVEFLCRDCNQRDSFDLHSDRLYPYWQVSRNVDGTYTLRHLEREEAVKRVREDTNGPAKRL